MPATAAGLRPEVLPALLEQLHGACRDCGGAGEGDGHSIEVFSMQLPESYFWLLSSVWAAGDAFVIVEHDVVAGPGVLGSFAQCPEPWCAFSYEVFAGDLASVYGGAYGLGCTRFSAELLAAEPDAVEAAGELELDGTGTWPKRSYGVMDSTLTNVLRRRGYDAHQHHPNVEHLHAYNREGVTEQAWPAAARTW